MSGTESRLSTPDQTLSKNDPGDETARRFRFQYAWTAIVCCALLDDTNDIVEVFCEHHEDILLKHKDGSFAGQQVKTRESDQPPWKASEDAVRGSLARFVELEASFPGQFRAFRFVTNHPLYAAKNAQSLGHVLHEIKCAETVESLSSAVKKLLSRVAADAGATEVTALQALKKCTAHDGLPKMQDANMRLIDSLVGIWTGAEDCSYAMVAEAATSLVDHCARAASLDHQQALPGYMGAVSQPEADLAARIDGKRLTKVKVHAVLSQGIQPVAALIGKPGKQPKLGQGSAELLLKKLDAGGFSAVSCNSAADLRDKSDYLALKWTQKFGHDKGLARYDHIRSIALSEAARAFEATRVDDGHFGPAMRNELAERFQARRVQGGQLYDCSNDHLEGFTYALTAECQVQWSIDRPWEDE